MFKKFFYKIKDYLISLLIPWGIGLLSALISGSAMKDFQNLDQPPLSPPMILFPIVWSILYTLMGISAVRVYKNARFDKKAAKDGLSYYAASLVVNFFWSILFFNFKAYLIAFVWLLLLLLLIVKTIVEYHKVDRLAAYLEIPYAVWVAFAGYLTMGVYILNR